MNTTQPAPDVRSKLLQRFLTFWRPVPHERILEMNR